MIAITPRDKVKMKFFLDTLSETDLLNYSGVTYKKFLKWSPSKRRTAFKEDFDAIENALEQEDDYHALAFISDLREALEGLERLSRKYNLI